MKRDSGIGFDRRIDIEWLDVAAACVAKGEDPKAVRVMLVDFLDGKVAGANKSGTARYKTVNVLSRTWSNVFSELIAYRNDAISFLPSLAPRERLALHWSMLMATYAFFGDVATNTGRLLSLQGSLTLSQLTRRMQERWGDRSTLNRATRRVVRSMVQWGAVADTKNKGVYVQPAKPIPVHGDLAKHIVEGLLIHEGVAVPIEQAIRHPAFFPFDVSLRANDLRESSRLTVHRQGLDQDVVYLAD